MNRDDLETPATGRAVAIPKTANWRRHRDLALVALAVIASIAGLYVAKAALAPVLFAILFALLLSPSVDWLRRRGLPRSLGSVLVVLALLSVIGASFNALWDPAREWLDTAPATMRTLERKLRPLTRFIAKVESVSDQAGRMAEPVPTTATAALRPVQDDARGLVVSTQAWGVTLLTTVMLTDFLLASGPALLAKWGSDTRKSADDRRLLRLAETVRVDLARYFGALTLSNLALGLGTALAMYALDMPNPLLWGAVAFTLNYVPYVGSVTTFVLLSIVALVSFDDAGQAVAVAATYVGLATLEGQVLQPILVGRRLDLSPLVVFLGLWFGGWLWGIAGVALAVPVMVAGKAAFEAAVSDKHLHTDVM